MAVVDTIEGYEVELRGHSLTHANTQGYMMEVQLRADPAAASSLERPLLVWLQV
jgi:hypothetical protein